jgi:hypothetical protein
MEKLMSAAMIGITLGKKLPDDFWHTKARLNATTRAAACVHVQLKRMPLR